jgi:hypothetical protein
MLLNELAQWAVLIILAFMVMGLLRQLGQFIIPRKEQLLARGPDVGERIPHALVDESHQAALSEEMASSGAEFGYLAVIREDCLGCGSLVERLQESDQPLPGPLVVVLDGESSEFRSRVEAVAGIVIDDPRGRRAKDVGISAAPFVLEVDRHMRIRNRAISGDIFALIDDWSSEQVLQQV